jgi:hypothetical protein
MYASMVENPVENEEKLKAEVEKHDAAKRWMDNQRDLALEVISVWTLNTAIMRYFDTQKLVMLEKMEEATTDGERLGYAENINLLGNYKAQSINMDALYVRNLEVKYLGVYRGISCADIEKSIDWMGNNRIIGPNADFTGAKSIHYNMMYRTIQDRQHDEFRGLVAKKLCSNMGVVFEEVPASQMETYDFIRC